MIGECERCDDPSVEIVPCAGHCDRTVCLDCIECGTRGGGPPGVCWSCAADLERRAATMRRRLTVDCGDDQLIAFDLDGEICILVNNEWISMPPDICRALAKHLVELANHLQPEPEAAQSPQEGP